MQIIPLCLLACSLGFALPQVSPTKLVPQTENAKALTTIIISFEFDEGRCHYSVVATYSTENGGAGSISRNCGGSTQTIYFAIKKKPVVIEARLQHGDIISTTDEGGTPIEVEESEKDLWISQINQNWPTH